MAATDFSKPDPDLTASIGEPAPCFLCGAAVGGIGVYWHGSSGGDPRVIFLHGACAKNLGCHLISDAMDARMMQRQHTG